MTFFPKLLLWNAGSCSLRRAPERRLRQWAWQESGLWEELPEQRTNPVVLHVRGLVNPTPGAWDPGGQVVEAEEESQELAEVEEETHQESSCRKSDLIGR